MGWSPLPAGTMKKEHDRLIGRYGRTYREDYGWADGLIEPPLTFAGLEAKARKEDRHDYPELTGRVSAGRRGRGAGGLEVDGPLSLDDLTAPRGRAAVPTFAEYVPVVSAAVTDGTRKAYGT